MTAETERREDVPLTIRQISELAQIHPKAAKRRLQRSGEPVLFRMAPRGQLYATLSACRRVFGAEFGTTRTDAERIAELEGKVRELRRDLNASLARQREFQRVSHAWFKRVQSLETAAQRAHDGSCSESGCGPTRPKSDTSGDG